MADDPVRFTDILTTASAVANYLGAPEVTAAHLLEAMDILAGDKTLDDLGRPRSPLLGRVEPAGGRVHPQVRELAQRWFAALGSNPMATLTGEQYEALKGELRNLADG